MRRLLLPRSFAPGEIFAAAGKDFHYLAHVLRVREGSTLPAGDAAGGRYLLTLEKREAARLLFRVQKEERAGSPLPEEPELALCVCLPKPAKMDIIVRMTTEIGVSRIVPLVSDYSAVKEKDAGRLGERTRRWEKIARAAFEQSGRESLPAVDGIVRLRDLAPARTEDGELAFYADETASSADGTAGLAHPLHELLGRTPVRRVRCLIGPEGGLSGRERESLGAKEFVPVFLGKNILRTETAAAFACAAVKLLLLEKASWKKN